jgi:hypothetical protein
VQRWEYLSVEFAWDEGAGVWDADGERAAPDLTHLLAPYGAEGWEMVGFAPDRWLSAGALGGVLGAEPGASPWEVEVYRAVFKRPAAAS